MDGPWRLVARRDADDGLSLHVLPAPTRQVVVMMPVVVLEGAHGGKLWDGWSWGKWGMGCR